MNVRGRGYNNYYSYPWTGYYNPAYAQLSSCYCKKSFLRILNTYSSDLDVQVNEILMAEDLKTYENTKYAKIAPGLYKIRIFSGKPKKLVFESDINIGRNLSYTGVIVGDTKDTNDMAVLMIPEAKDNYITNTMTSIRISNLLVDAPELELVTSDGTILFSGVDCGDVSNNVAVPSGKYTLSLREKNNLNKEVKSLNIDFSPKQHYTLFIVGKYEDSDIKILIPEDGINYLELC